MAAISPSHYRRAVVAALMPHLTPSALEQALHAVTTQKPGNAISEIIAYVDALAGRGVIDSGQSKRLYGELFRALNQPENSLPADPFTASNHVPGILRSAPVAQGIPAINPATPPAPLRRNSPAPVVAAPAPATTAAPAKPATSAPEAPAVLAPAEAVFVALVTHAKASLHQFHSNQLAEFSSDLTLALHPGKTAPVAGFLQSWHEEKALAHWAGGKSISQLSTVLHGFYTALCETLGPVGADQLLTRAVQAAGQIPAAAGFSPGQLL